MTKEDQLAEAFQHIVAVQSSLVEAGIKLGDALNFLEDGQAHHLMAEFSDHNLKGMEGVLALGQYLQGQGAKIS